MKQERAIIAGAKLSSLVVLTCIPVILVVAMTVSLLTGWLSLEDGMYYRVYGPVVLIFFYGGLAYATYEFASTTLKRKEYISTDGKTIFILYYRPIRISEISDIFFESGLLSDNLIILENGGRKTKVRTHFLQDDADLVLQRLAKLAGTPLDSGPAPARPRRKG